MKIKFIVSLLVLLLALPAVALPPKTKMSPGSMSLQTDNDTFIDVNRILMFVTNHGNFGRDLSGIFGYDYGTWFPYGGDTSAVRTNDGSAGDKSPNYASGLWIGGTVDLGGGTLDTLVIVSEYASEYAPGPMENGTFMEDKPEYRVYKLYRDSLANNPNDDYENWPYDQGAPWRVDTTWLIDTITLDPLVLDTTGIDEISDPYPDMIGDQMLWSVFNGADPDRHDGRTDAGETGPMGIEVKQTIFGFDRLGSLGNIVFMRYRVYNKGNDTYNNFMLSLWCDPDLGSAGNDYVGCDTNLSVGYVYNSVATDNQYPGVAVPCMGFDFFQGPLVPGTAADTGRMWGQLWPGMANLGMVSFNKYINGTDPDDYQQTFQYMNGLDGSSNGAPYIYNGDTLLYFHTGDPVAGTGDLDTDAADRRWMQTTGPITFAPGDSTEILAAMVIGQGGDYLNSITIMKLLDDFAQRVYESGFNPPEPPAKPVVETGVSPGKISLTWDDTSEVDQGDFVFEGYSIYQGESDTGPWQLLETYDLINDVQNALVDTFPESGIFLPVIMKSLKNNGLTYRYVVDRDVINGGPLRDVTEYFFRVTAFSFAFGDTTNAGEPVPAGDRFGESETVVTVVPKAGVAGSHYPYAVADTIAVEHVSGGSDGLVAPLVMDRLQLDGHDYEVTFVEDPIEGTLWYLVDVTASPPDTIFADESNLTGDGEYQRYNGFLMVVSGPPSPGVKSDDDDGWEIPNGTRRFTWANASGFGWESFHGALGWGGPSDTHGFGDNDPIPPAEHVAVLLKLAAVGADGSFNPADENVSYAYRYGRGFTGAPAQPEFAPYMINTTDPGYSFQDFEKSCPLSAWNLDNDPPTRMTLGYLENNAGFAVLDGKYWPRFTGDFDEGGPAAGSSNTDGGGPREWLWIFLDDYSETVNPAFQGDATTIPLPVLYWATWNRREDVAWEDGDEFQINPARIILPADKYTFTASMPELTSTEGDLEAIKAVPNPFYLYGGYDPSPGSYKIQWHHLPAKCTIKIYNLAGDLVRTIDKDDPGPLASWDVLTEQGLPVSSGIYIWVVDAPGFGTKMGKMAVFVESEVLRIF